MAASTVHADLTVSENLTFAAAMLGVEKFLADVRDADGVELLDERLHTQVEVPLVLLARVEPDCLL
ncbi:MAG: hypothetical protein KY462_13440 [Actinobacteria bacterium]|nr:hypothetical protein [Actinomycetota bacterium]